MLKIDCTKNAYTNYFFSFFSTPLSRKKYIYLHHLIVFFIALQLVDLVQINKSLRAHEKKSLAVCVCELHHQNLSIIMCQFLGPVKKT